MFSVDAIAPCALTKRETTKVVKTLTVDLTRSRPLVVLQTAKKIENFSVTVCPVKKKSLRSSPSEVELEPLEINRSEATRRAPRRPGPLRHRTRARRRA